jgi:hypothetical protein
MDLCCFLSGQDDLLLSMTKVSKEKTALWEALLSTVLATCPGDHIRDAFDSVALRDELLLSLHVFKFIYIKCGKAPLL